MGNCPKEEKKMYEELLAKVMSDDVTLPDWKKFCDYLSTLPDVTLEALQEWVREEDLHQANKQAQEFVGAAYHVASKLTIEEIFKDMALTLAYILTYYSSGNFS